MEEITVEEFENEWKSQFDETDEPKTMTWHCMYCKKPYKANWGSSDYCSIECGQKMFKFIRDEYNPN